MDNPINNSHLDVPGLLKSHGHQPDKRLGQNFLIAPKYLQKVVQAGDIHAEDTILEIGAGIGNLTRLLAVDAKQVIAVEIDDDLIPILISTTQSYPNVKIIQGDILAFDLSDLINSPTYQVVANIPYYITSKLIRKLMTSKTHPQRVVLTIQKEVAERICSTTGKFSLLGLSVQVFGHPVIVSRIPAGAFYPPPKVDSAIVRVDLHPTSLISENLLESFFMLAKAGFGQKRKTLRNSLSAGINLDKDATTEMLKAAGIDPQKRAESLAIEEWERLAIEYSQTLPPG